MKKIILIFAAGYLLLTPAIYAQTIRVAAAANLQAVMQALQKDFKARSGIEIEPVVGSSGKLVAQIKNGAPFDVFLSADMAFPADLYKDGFALQQPKAYAYGSLIICSNKDIGFENWTRTLLTDRIKKIAIANPAIAPYGKAAKQALTSKGILDDVQNKIVYGESIAQVNTYITTGTVEVGFTTRALINDPANKTKLYWKAIDPKIYEPIEQGAVVIKTTANKAGAQKFYNYLFGAAAKKIFVKFGYNVQ